MIFGKFERMIAFRYLRARRQEGFISVIAGFSLLGIALGVATLIIVMSVMNGFREEFLGKILGVNGHLNVYGTSGSLGNYDAITGKIALVPGVVAVHPLVEGQVLVSSPGHAIGALVRGEKVSDLKAQPLIADHIVAGSLEALDDDSIMIGDGLARSMGVRLGDSLSVLSPDGNPTAFGTTPRVKSYKIAAIFNVGEYHYDGSFVFMPLSAAQLFFKVPGAASSLEVFVKDPDNIQPVSQQVRQVAGPTARVLDWTQSQSAYFNAIQTERNVMFLILTLIIVVAAFNIISSMIMLVKDKAHDIAILRTMGATQGMILRIFFLAGASVGVVGTILGFGLGLAFADNIESIRQILQHFTGTDLFNAEIYFLSTLPAKVEPAEVAAVVGMAFALSFLATIYPSWRAARLDPVEALRYE
ncbi:LolC/E family lipoprotein releasing system, protein [Aliidongia dinghuensis]|uniref:LolC/E family lipoprotein releasing system, protein n=1 Tax=Aliidongia dinghuensis TaxID=1867774 RepID=A0A8J2YYC0_9PROT|nr:lipoprotein-releasing ABC transporter permease subunit [Aliidongia dinghuensis]GGF40481.1 LolC/E family lipoprotein releasing system, protein [Aliidongia dinghuensis]